MRKINDSLEETPTHTRNEAGLTGQNILKKPGRGGAKPPDTLPGTYSEQELPFDPVAVENLRQSIIAYDMMLLKNPELKQYVEDKLNEHRINHP